MKPHQQLDQVAWLVAGVPPPAPPLERAPNLAHVQPVVAPGGTQVWLVAWPARDFCWALSQPTPSFLVAVTRNSL